MEFIFGAAIGGVVTWAALHKAIVSGWYTVAVEEAEKVENKQG